MRTDLAFCLARFCAPFIICAHAHASDRPFVDVPLAPYGFQSERRSFYEAQDVYLDMWARWVAWFDAYVKGAQAP